MPGTGVYASRPVTAPRSALVVTSPRQAWIGARALVADHRDPLNLDHHAGKGEARDGDQGTAWIIAVREHLPADFGELIAVSHIGDEYRHGHQVGEAAAGLFQRLIHQAEGGAHLRLEVLGGRAAASR